MLIKKNGITAIVDSYGSIESTVSNIDVRVLYHGLYISFFAPVAVDILSNPRKLWLWLYERIQRVKLPIYIDSKKRFQNKQLFERLEKMYQYDIVYYKDDVRYLSPDVSLKFF